MSSLRAFRWFIAAVLLLTIGWKIAIQPDNQDYLTENLVKFFERNHFDVVVTDELVNYMPIISPDKVLKPKVLNWIKRHKALT